MREEIEKNGGIKLVYIDPPFDVGADFTMDIEVGDDTLKKEITLLEEKYSYLKSKKSPSLSIPIHIEFSESLIK